jgi:urease gamma subunit
MMTLSLTRLEHALLKAAVAEAVDYWSVTDLDGVRESKSNQQRIAAGRALLNKIEAMT